MSLMAAELRRVWDALYASGSQRRHALLEVRIRNLRGIGDLQVRFPYPVCVLAGPNGCGKSTVLFACACAYRVPGRGPRDFTPGRLFPNFTDRRTGTLSDSAADTAIELHYLHDNAPPLMVWKRKNADSRWSRSFKGFKGAKQPEREVYLRTLANLTNPSEIRSLLQLGRKPYRAVSLTPDLLIFAKRILRPRYRNLSVIAAGGRDLLFAETEGQTSARYSEFHMSSGERSVLRISKDISRLRDALILIDEVETGLHPYTQQQAMLELQRIALRQNLQIIAASHSPVVLDSVPPEARVFLDRDDRTGEAHRLPAYRDIFQKALYGQSRDKLSILCEDDVAEGIILGMLDVLNVDMGLRPEDFVIGRNTGRDEFPAHIRTLSKFDKLREFIFVLDGDSRGMQEKIEKTAEEYGHSARLLFLPGNGPPERWIWETLSQAADRYAPLLGLQPADMTRAMRDIERLMAGALLHGDPAKSLLEAFAGDLERTPAEIARIVGRREAQKNSPKIADFLIPLRERIQAWRQL